MRAVLDYFAQDPLRILYAVGGSGGLWYWVSTWRGRIRLKIRSIKHQFKSVDDPNLDVELRFEVENLGDSPTSIEPDVLITGYDKNRKAWTDVLTLHSPDRRLEPQTPHGFMATGKPGADYIFWIYRSYRFQITRGRSKTVRFRTQPNTEPLPFWRFVFELSLFRIFGWLPFIQ